MKRGYVKIHRKILDSSLFETPETFTLFMYLLVSATHRPFKTMIGDVETELLPGQFFTGRKKLSEKLKSSEQKIRTSLKRLEKSGKINQQSNQHGTLISIINWDTYQGDEPIVNQPINQRVTNAQPTGNQRVTNAQPTGNQRVTTKQTHSTIPHSTKAHKHRTEESFAPSDSVESSEREPAKAKMPMVSPGESPEEFHKRYMVWASAKIISLLEENRETWAIAYPAVDLNQECSRAVSWLQANPAKRKKELSRFITNWLDRKQEKLAAYSSPHTDGTRRTPKEQRTVDACNSFLEDIRLEREQQEGKYD